PKPGASTTPPRSGPNRMRNTSGCSIPKTRPAGSRRVGRAWRTKTVTTSSSTAGIRSPPTRRRWGGGAFVPGQHTLLAEAPAGQVQEHVVEGRSHDLRGGHADPPPLELPQVAGQHPGAVGDP